MGSLLKILLKRTCLFAFFGTDEHYIAQIRSTLLLFTTQLASSDVHNRVLACP